MFSGSSDDDTNFAATKPRPTTSKLTSLFAQEESLTSTNQSLGYVPKKATKPGTATPPIAAGNMASGTANQSAAAASSAASSTTVIFACLVNLIRYDANGTAVPVGQRAVALLKNVNSMSPLPVHVLVAYEPNTQKQDCIAALTEHFTFTISPPSYCLFYDDQRQYWCIQLPADQVELMAKHVALCKAAQIAQSNNQPPVIIQDLIPIATERAVGNGDQAKVKYTMYLTSATHPKGIGTVIGSVGSDDKPKQIKIGNKKELQGIEQGLVGMKKGGKRFLVIPSHLAYGAQQAGNIPPNSTILVEITLIKAKFAEPEPKTTTATNATPATAATTTTTVPAASTAAATSIPTIPVIPTNVTLPVPGSGVGGPSIPSASSNDGDHNDEDDHRSHLAKKMAMMGFKMPGLPGATDPEHTAANQAAAARRMSQDSRTEEEPHSATSSPPSPAHSHIIANSNIPTLMVQTQPPPSHLSVAQPVNRSMSSSPAMSPAQPTYNGIPQQLQQSMQQPQPQTPLQQFYTAQHQQPQQASLYQQQYQQQLPQQQPATSPYYQSEPQQLYNSAAPSPSHTPHSHSMSHIPSPFYSQPQQQQPAGAMYGQPPLIQLDSKLDAIQASLNQSARILGTNVTSLVYESPLSGAQLIKGINVLITERDDAKQKLDTAERRVAELSARVSSLQERHETYVTENNRQMERRYESYAEELKHKNQQIQELQQQYRTKEMEQQQLKTAKEDIEMKSNRLKEELAAEKEITAQKVELERRVAELNRVLSEAQQTASEKEHQNRSLLAEQTAAAEKQIASIEKQLHDQQQAAQREQESLQHRIHLLTQQSQQADRDINQLKQQLFNTQSQLQTAQSQLSVTQRELEASRAETVSVLDQARRRLESDKEQMMNLLQTAKQEEYERGQQETLEEVKIQTNALKEKAKLTIETLSNEKAELEQQLQASIEEKNEIINSSRAYIDKMKGQLAAKLAEIEEERETNQNTMNEDSLTEGKQQALKQLYGGIARILQQHGEHRWRAQEVAQAIKAEMQFVMTGERPEINIEEDKVETSTTKDDITTAASTEQPTSTTKEEVPLFVAAAAVASPEPASGPVDNDENQPLLEAVQDDEQPPSELVSDSSTIPQTSGEPDKEHKQTKDEEHQSQVLLKQVIDDSNPLTDHMIHTSLNGTHETDKENIEPAEHVNIPPSQTDHHEHTDYHTEPHSVIPDIKPAAVTEPNPVSAAANPSDVNGVDITNTFEYPLAGPQHEQKEEQEHPNHIDTIISLTPTSNPSDKEEADTLAPLPAIPSTPLSVNPDSGAANNTSYIAPPTPTLLTPPASAARDRKSQFSPLSTVGASVSQPTNVFGAPVVEDPFADPFAEEVTSPHPTTNSAAHIKPNAAIRKQNPLFDDEDDEDNSVFAAGTKPAIQPVVASTKPNAVKSSLFGEDDDD